MTRRRFVWALVFVLILSLVAVVEATTRAAPAVWLKANQSVTAHCVDSTGELMIEFAGDDEALVTCRVWVGNE